MNEKYIKYNIDINKLQRDYCECPLKHGEFLCEQDFHYLYIELNLSRPEIADFLNISVVKVSRHQKRYNIIKDVNAYIQNTTRIIKEKYGVTTFSQTPDFRHRTEETNRKKFGRDWNTQTHISTDTLNIINNKENLEKYIRDNNILNGVELANKLGLNSSEIERKIIDYNLLHLFDYSKSKEEKELIQYINQYYETENNTRKYLDGQEIDIYVPKLKLGIEFNGNYWHGEIKKDNKLYHQNKSLLAESKGIFIYHIFEYEWNTKKEQIINQLNNLLGINQFKIGARKCIIKEVSNKEKNEFLMNNHLQGEDKSSVKLGLYYENKLVSLMTFCKPRFNKKYEWELSRFCSLANYNVIGGASKLFNYFVENYTPKSIISYSNIAHTKGNLYSNLGFTLMNVSDPNYVWIKNGEIYSRYQCQKHKLLEQGFEGNSEEEIMKSRGFFRIYMIVVIRHGFG